jgi:uncharacterized damage-inducible protein DinB
MAAPVWLRGPIAGISPQLQPVAHALMQANEDVQGVLPSLTDDFVWARPGGAASIGFHATHSLGSLDRLFTYARGEALSDAQMQRLAAEKAVDASAGTARELAANFADSIERALEQLRATRESELLAPREVGRGKLPSTVIGALFHAAEHTAGHVAQITTTAKILRSLSAE